MAVPLADHLPENGSISSVAKEKRRNEFEQWANICITELNQQLEGVIELSAPSSDVFDELNSTYWELLEETVRPRIKSREAGKEVVVDRHKIASLTELLLVHYRPFKHLRIDPALENSLNARLANFVAESIVGGWNPEVVGNLAVSDSFSSEHLAWLRNSAFDTRSASIFSNAATWYLVEKIYLERSERTMLVNSSDLLKVTFN